MNKFILLTILYLLPKALGTANNSLSDCNTVASAFYSTCGGVAASSVAAMAGANVICTSGFNTTNCPGTYYTNGTCIFTRKLCVTCSGSSPTRIRVQTNGLPGYCPSVPTTVALLSTTIDFTVNFNPDVNINSLNQNPQNQVALDQIVCNITSQSSVPSASNFVLSTNSTSVDTLAGVSVNGVSIENVNSANDVDPFYPPNVSQTEHVDSCLGHPNFASVYHYHMGTGCALSQPTANVTACTSNAQCSANVSQYGISTFSSYRTQTVFGIARDGHVIYGPYYSSGVEVTTGFDICNGVFYDTVGNYAYFVTRTFPYITGCFGPGNYPSFYPNCTTNPASAYRALNLTTSSTNTNTTTTATTVNTTSSGSRTSGNSAVQNKPFNVKFFLVFLFFFQILIL